MHFDPTPDAVKLFRINAVGLGVSILAMFGAMFWWMGDVFTAMGDYSWLMWAIMGGSALFAAAFHLLPAVVPRRQWGYVMAWVQIAMGLTSGTGTLPTIPVLIGFVKKDVMKWFDRKPIGPRANSPTATRATMVALIGYYTVMSVVPFGVAGWVGKLDTNAPAVEVSTPLQQNKRIEVKRGIVETMAVAGPEEIIATKLTTDEPWALSHQPGPVAVTVWASYCGSCSRQFRAIAKNPPKVKHVTLALDCDGNADKVRHKLGHTNIISEALCDQDSMKVDVLPTTIIYDANNRRRATLSGYQSSETINQAADAVAALPR